MKTFYALSPLILMLLPAFAGSAKPAQPIKPGNVYAIQEGYVDANGVMTYYKIFGHGKPLVLAHGGPGASHDYFLPYLAPLARHYQLVFIDERGSGRSPALENVSAYTVESMVEDVEAVRQALNLGQISLLGHSYGGVLAQAYALKYQKNLSHLILASTFSSTAAINEVFVHMKEKMPADLRDRINKMESDGLYGHGKDYEKNRYTSEYMTAAWGDGYFPYLYRNHPDPNYDPIDNGKMSWDLYRECGDPTGSLSLTAILSPSNTPTACPQSKYPPCFWWEITMNAIPQCRK
jgi:pimeloyl-ACP methyl ester carboxylesterase